MVLSRVIIGVTPFRALITLLITYFLASLVVTVFVTLIAAFIGTLNPETLNPQPFRSFEELPWAML